MVKLSPSYTNSNKAQTLNKYGPAHDLLPFKENKCDSQGGAINPVFDYVPPELLTIFLSNVGGNAPSYVYRLLTELYHSKDILAN